MADAVIFDMDGLMIDTERVWMRSWEPALSELGLEYVEGLGEAARGSTGEPFNRVVREFLGDDVDADAVWDHLKAKANESFERHIDKMPGLDDLLGWLADHRVPCAVASSSEPDQIAHHLAMIGVEDHFAAAVSGKEAGRSKPFPDVFLLAADRLGVDPAHCLVLEDSHNGVRAGAAGGFPTVMVPDLSEATDEMRALCVRVCPSLTVVRDLLEAGEL